MDYYYADNEGHIMIKMRVTASSDNVIINKEERFAQGIFLPYGITSDDNATAVRNGGMGSTGK